MYYIYNYIVSWSHMHCIHSWCVIECTLKLYRPACSSGMKK